MFRCTRLIILIYIFSCIAGTAWSTTTSGNVALGKFYTFSVSPDASYPDRWPVVVNGSTLSDGVKLTDGLYGSSWPLDGWVGWVSKPVEICLDLGKPVAISNVKIDCASRSGWDIYFPASVSISVSMNGTAFTSYGASQSFESDTTGWSTKTLTFTSSAATARWVKFTVAASQAWSFIDEMEVNGDIVNTSKYVPTTGCYHGAFPVNSYNYLDISGFESLISPKTTSMTLWYADWEQSFQNSIGYVIDECLNGRFMEVGWLPYNTTAAQIASGSHDTFLYTWLTDCAAKNYPIWLRPMNEMNGSWTWPNNGSSLEYGGNPQTYRWAWRRMYNIAEKVGCTEDKQIFVWSPDTYESSNINTQMAQYYPGDGYVDWVGVSAYDWVGSFDDIMQEPYDTYSANKPMMISEGGCKESTIDPTWKPQWIQDWFTLLETKYTRVKAAVWFHAADSTDYRINTTTTSLNAYQTYCQDPYFIGLDKTTPTGSISINSGSLYTNDRNVVLSLSAVDNDGGCGVWQMRFSQGSAWTSWETYSTSKSITLSATEGTKNAYVQFKDYASNMSSIYRSSIILDTTLPSGSISINSGADLTNSSIITLTLYATDSKSGVSEMQLSSDGLNWNSWEAYAASMTWNLGAGVGIRRVYARYKDAAGNVSPVYSDWILMGAGVRCSVVAGLSGMLVRIWGVVTDKAGDGSWFIINDGSGQVKIDLTGVSGAAAPNPGKYAGVNGLVGSGAVRPRTSADINIF